MRRARSEQLLRWLQVGHHLATVTIHDRRCAAGTHHDGVTDIGLDAAVDRLEALTPIDREVALAGLNPVFSPPAGRPLLSTSLRLSVFVFFRAL